MDKETELNILTKQKQKEELQSIRQEVVALREKIIAFLKEGGSLSEQFIKTKSVWQLSILTYEADNYIKMIDVFIDILKFLIPTLFTIGTVTRIIPQFSGTSIFVFGASVALLILLAIVLIIRMKYVKSYVSKFKKEHTKFASEYIDWQEHMEGIRAKELDAMITRFELLQRKDKTIRP